MRFAQPTYLLLLVPALAGLVLSFKRVHGMARFRKKLAFIIRFALAALLVCAIAGPEAYRPNEGLGVVFVLDRSDSVQDADRARAEEFVDGAMRRLGEKDQAAVVVFGKEAMVEAAPGGRRRLAKVSSQVDPSASDLAGAIRLASAVLPEGKARRIVLLSDGNETAGDAMGAAQVAATDGVALDVVPLGGGGRAAEAAVADLQAPNEARADAPFELRAEVESSTSQKAVIALDRDGVIIKRIPASLAPGRNVLVMSDKLATPGFHRYRVTLLAEQDRDNRNNVGMAFVTVRGRPRLLVLQQNPAKSSLADALKKAGLSVEVAGPGGAPVRAEELQTYDAIVFNDFNAASLTRGQMQLIQSAVRDTGVGFAMVGGENSFLPGGYYATPIAEVLPVDLDIRQRKVFPSTTMLVVVDGSGSMAMVEDGAPKIRLAARAAEETVRLLSPRDRLGVAVNTDDTEFAAPIQKLTNKPYVISQIRKMDTGGGGIYMKPSMDFAAEHLRKENTQVRHLIILADGSDADMQDGCIPLALELRREKITTTIVAIGDGPHVPFLRELAKAGGGRFYLATRAGQLPAIFTQDASIMSRSAIEEGAFYPKLVAGEPITKGLDSTPPLLAYCLTDSRPLATVGMKTAKDDPLLAAWQYGLGTSLAFTSDAQPRWASHWVAWEGFGAFWAQASRSVLRRAAKSKYLVRVRQEAGRGVVEVKAADALGFPLRAIASEVRASLPGGRSVPVELSQEAPGLFRGSFDASDIGSYIVTIAENDPNGGKRVQTSGFSLPYPPEYRSFRSNRALLERMAQTAGGLALSSPMQALRPAQEPGVSIRELWPTFVLMAALLLPIDVAVRRIALPWSEIWAKLWLLARRRRAQAPVAATVDRLRAAKSRVRADLPSIAEPLSRSHPETQLNDQPREKVPVAAGLDEGSIAERLLESKRSRHK